jgi:polygalacturonase
MTQPPDICDRLIFHDLRSYGALGDAQTLDTAAFQAAIDTCHEHGGGTVWVPAGQYVIGTIFFRDNITLHLDAGATLLGSTRPDEYPVLPKPSRLNMWI